MQPIPIPTSIWAGARCPRKSVCLSACLSVCLSAWLPGCRAAGSCADGGTLVCPYSPAKMPRCGVRCVLLGGRFG
jgi:hypothetical protein